MDIKKLIDLEKLRVKPTAFDEEQKKYLHLVDPRFFSKSINPFRQGKEKDDYIYETDLSLKENIFHLHSLIDPIVLEQGNIRRFLSYLNKKYITEKYIDDKWVSEGNNHLAIQLEKHLKENLNLYKRKKIIKLIDFGPCGGAITTLFALRSLAKFDLLDKTRIVLLDIVPNVLEATILGEYTIPQKMIEEYKLDFAGDKGEKYKRLLKNGILFNVKEWYKHNKKNQLTDKALKLSDNNQKKHGDKCMMHYYRGDGEVLPKEIRNFDIVLSGYTHHHMNLIARKMFCRQMEKATKKSGFIGVVDFFVKDYKEYMKWYQYHFKKYNDSPPVEYPLIDGKIIASWYKKTDINYINNKLFRSYLLSGVKQ